MNYKYHYSTDYLHKLVDHEYVGQVVNDKDKKPLSILIGVLGAIEKGGKTVDSDESSVGIAQHYSRILLSPRNVLLENKDFKKISELIKKFNNSHKK